MVFAVGAYEFASYVGAGIAAAGISQMTSPIKTKESIIISSPNGSNYAPSNQPSSSPVVPRRRSRRVGSRRRRRRRKRKFQSDYNRLFVKEPNFYKLPK